MSSPATPEAPAAEAPQQGPRARRKRSFLGRLIRLLLLLVVLGAAAAGGLFYWGYERFNAPGPSATETTVVVPRGTGLVRIAGILTDAGVIEDPLVFRIGVMLEKQEGALKAGEYAFAAGISMRGIMQQMVEGRVVKHFFTVPEGRTSWEIVQFLNAAADLEGAPLEAIPEEGSLLPETYQFERGETRQGVLGRMAKAQQALQAQLWDGRAEGLPIDSEAEWVILASIVEKETGLADERPLVASVFVNRLKKGMRLQSDPTVVYAVTGGEGPLGRGLTRKELDRVHPYNTYTTDGLPPGPIANPGRASLEAVLHPADTKYLYFVADGTGGHVFAETLEEHNRNVKKWREIEKQRQQQGKQ